MLLYYNDDCLLCSRGIKIISRCIILNYEVTILFEIEDLVTTYLLSIAGNIWPFVRKGAETIVFDRHGLSRGRSLNSNRKMWYVQQSR